eukprot:scaffold55099_cov38-Cyclotella_meneghiniana.AAC.1
MATHEAAWDRGMEGEVNNHVFLRSAMNTRQEPLLGVGVGSMTVDYGGYSGFCHHVGCGDCGRVVSAVSMHENDVMGGRCVENVLIPT